MRTRFRHLGDMSTLRPLPEGDGPKLEPFTCNLLADDVEFIEILGHNGIHGVIIKTRIGDHLYAIKFFPETVESKPEYYARNFPKVPIHKRAEFESHFTPFNQECRAFGRLKEVNHEHLAVKVHGYVLLKVDQALEVKMRNALLKMPREPKTPPKTAASLLITSSGVVKGIVKDWVEPAKYREESDIPPHKIDNILCVSHFPRMLEELHQIHRCGIVIRDLSISQYVNGILVDFSMAWTMPHPIGPGGGLKPTWTFQSLAAWDLYCFQKKVIDLWNIYLNNTLDIGHGECRLRVYRHPNEYSLRPSPSRQRPFLPIINHEEEDEDKVLDMVELPRYDPGAFNDEVATELILENKRKRDEERVGRARKKRKVVRFSL
ncbi:hypothetical protein BHE90_003312 [Fusarium euwallaceae]|uniref:Uncharacterized protein n=1 Tax=Fusarium euwallaceae TaxID=1147111 RepID=A0A430M2G7_9HYPO|nr:hypothetical protein BHE90_003312 [Fusarium euwallaceae]